MKLHYKGKFNGDEKSLPTREHQSGYVQYKEPENMKKLQVIMNIVSTLIMILFIGVAIVRAWLGGVNVKENLFLNIWVSALVSLLVLFPHEILHALCFKKDVYLYSNLKNGMLFVVGTEDMSKKKFIMMCLLPNIVFGFIPFIVFLFLPKIMMLGFLGALNIASGAGDYLNVFNTIRQVPSKAKIYSSGLHSYWYKS